MPELHRALSPSLAQDGPQAPGVPPAARGEGAHRGPHTPPAGPASGPGLLPSSRRYRRDSKLAQIYDSEILPAWSQPFGRMLLRRAHPLLTVLRPGRLNALDVFCATGHVTGELAAQHGEGLRLVAIDPAPPLLDVARRRLGPLAGKRVFFRSDAAEPRLPFDSDVYDLVVCNLGLAEVAEPRRLLSEMVRVARPGAWILTTLPLRGTFAEFYDLLERALSARRMGDALARLRAHLSTLPSAVEARSWLVEAGLQEARVDCDAFSLLFASAREFFFSPVIEYGPLPAWKEVVAGADADRAEGPAGGALQAVFWQIKGAIDDATVCPAEASQGRRAPAAPFLPFSLSVRAGCLCGRKPAQEPPPASDEEVVLGTGEIDILGLLPPDPRSAR